MHIAQGLSETPEDYVCKVAQTLGEACTLVEAGFEYVTEMNGMKLFRKRKWVVTNLKIEEEESEEDEDDWEKDPDDPEESEP